jgi:RNA polymerase sigma factor (sigma-70 family)
MGEFNIAALQKDLQSPNALSAWEAFLGEYSPILYQTARAYTADDDAAADCFLHICQHLQQNGYRRLLKFKPEGAASFNTWLRVVARNMCFDWHRSKSGRPRPFSSVHALSALELEIYDCRFARGLSEEETLQRLRVTFPDFDLKELPELERCIETRLSSRQRWILATRQRPVLSSNVPESDDENEDAIAQIADTRLDQECWLARWEQYIQLKSCVDLLPADERLLLQLRFEEDLSLDEIAKLVGLGDAQRVHRQMGKILKGLREGLEPAAEKK